VPSPRTARNEEDESRANIRADGQLLWRLQDLHEGEGHGTSKVSSPCTHATRRNMVPSTFHGHAPWCLRRRLMAIEKRMDFGATLPVHI